MNKKKPSFKICIKQSELAILEKFPYFRSKARECFSDQKSASIELPLDITLEEVRAVFKKNFHYTEKDVSRMQRKAFIENTLRENPAHTCMRRMIDPGHTIEDVRITYATHYEFISNELLDSALVNGLGSHYDSVFDNLSTGEYKDIPLESIDIMDKLCSDESDRLMASVPPTAYQNCDPFLARSMRYKIVRGMLNDLQYIARYAKSIRNCDVCRLKEEMNELAPLIPPRHSITVPQYILYSYWGLEPDNCRVEFGDMHRSTIEKMECDPMVRDHMEKLFLNFLDNLEHGNYRANIERLVENRDVFAEILNLVDEDQFLDIMGIKIKKQRMAFKRNWNVDYFVNNQ